LTKNYKKLKKMSLKVVRKSKVDFNKAAILGKRRAERILMEREKSLKVAAKVLVQIREKDKKNLCPVDEEDLINGYESPDSRGFEDRYTKTKVKIYRKLKAGDYISIHNCKYVVVNFREHWLEVMDFDTLAPHTIYIDNPSDEVYVFLK